MRFVHVVNMQHYQIDKYTPLLLRLVPEAASVEWSGDTDRFWFITSSYRDACYWSEQGIQFQIDREE